jgi:photosystem II stability/assembly factor-like uncharacterized protein
MSYKKITITGSIAAIAIIACLITVFATGVFNKKIVLTTQSNLSSSTGTSSGQTSNLTESEFITNIDSYQKTQSQNQQYELHMIDATNGWLIDGNGVYKTTNGGKTWENVSGDFWPSDTTTIKTSFLDADHAYISFTKPVRISNVLTQDTLLYTTQDGGHSWSKYDLSNDKNSGDIYHQNNEINSVIAMDFFSRNSGIIFMYQDGAMGTIEYNLYQTEDGGKTWREIAAGTRITNGPFDFRFIDNLHGYRFISASAYDNAIQITSDGGKSWSDPAIVMQYRYKLIASSLMPIYMTSTKKIALFTCQNGIGPLSAPPKTGDETPKGDQHIYNYFYNMTSDGKPGNKVTDFVTDLPLSDKTVSFPNVGNGFCIATVDGKTAFYRYNESTSKFNIVSQADWMTSAIQVQFVNSLTGFVLCSDTVYSTNDGGKSWSKHQV